MLTVIILTLIQSSFSLQDDPLPKTQLQMTEYGEYVTFIDEELHIPIISTENINCVHIINNDEEDIIKMNSKDGAVSDCSQNATISTQDATEILSVTGLTTGNVRLEFLDKDDTLTGSVIIRVFKSRKIDILAQVVGWTYNFFWTVSFYPQVIMNFRRRSVIGFNFDYLGYDLTGFISFSLYNCLLFWSPAVFALYQQRYPGSPNPITINDIVFCIHAVFIQLINTYQCMVFESNGQSMSKLCWSILIGTGTVSAIYALVIATGLVNGLNWLDLLIFGSYIKIGSSCIKYMPQVYLNWKRKCTLGFAIDKAILDFSGGTACYLQTIIQYCNAQDITIITSNAGKIGIGFVSCFFDIVLLIQHYCLYGQNNSVVIARDSTETDQNQSDSAFEPIISSKRLNSITGDAFSPMESAVLYHAPKGDLMISTASFKDVFSRDVNASQTWQDITQSMTGSRPMGSIVNSKSVLNSKGKLEVPVKNAKYANGKL